MYPPSPLPSWKLDRISSSLTSKDPLFLEEALELELLAVKRTRHLADRSSDQETREHLSYLGAIHEKNYQLLMQHTTLKERP